MLDERWGAAEPPKDFSDKVMRAWDLETGARPAAPRGPSLARRAAVPLLAAAAASALTYLAVRPPTATPVGTTDPAERAIVAERAANEPAAGTPSVGGPPTASTAAPSPPATSPTASVEERERRSDPLATEDGRPWTIPPMPMVEQRPPSAVDQERQRSGADIQKTLAPARATIKRACWDAHLAEPGPPTARVSVQMTIEPDGRVGNIRATGGDGYPNLRKCVHDVLRGVRFTPADAPTTVSIPFSFSR